MDKNELRVKYNNIRKTISAKEQKSSLAAENLFQSEMWQKAKVVALYLSFGSEMSTKKIVKRGLVEGKIIAVPVTDNESYVMDFYRFSLEDETTDSALGMAEPMRKEENLILPEEIDLCILPGLAFDIYGHRLGMGKGCYDRYLPKLRLDAQKAALCFREQITNEILPFEKFDVDLDWLINEERIIKCR